MGCDARRLPRRSSGQFVRLWQSKLVIGDCAGCCVLLRDRRATARGEGCERLNGSAPLRPLEAPSLVVHSAKGCPPTNARAHARTRREDRVRAVQRSPRVPAEARSGASQQYYG
jgi:hypothetical protein